MWNIFLRIFQVLIHVILVLNFLLETESTSSIIKNWLKGSPIFFNGYLVYFSEQGSRNDRKLKNLPREWARIFNTN